MEKIWIKSYPQQVASEINLSLYQNIYDVYHEAVKNYSALPCFTNMECTLSFSELDLNVNKLASFLQNELKLVKGDRIAIQMPNILQFPIVLFAAFKLGLIVVNTNPLYTAPEMLHQFKDSGAKAIVILANYAHLLEKIIRETQIESVIITEIGDLFPLPKRVLVNSVIKFVKKMVPSYHLAQAYSFRQALNLGELALGRSHLTTKDTITQDDIAFLQYTGGTTGVAKGAVLTHKNIIANMLQISEWMRPKLLAGKEIAITPLPLYHIFSLTVNCLTFMRYGAHNILITNPRDFTSFIKDLQRYPFTVMTGVNTLFNALMNHKDFSRIDFTHLKVVVAGAMALQKSVSARWLELTKTTVVEGYGLTEASPVLCCNPLSDKNTPGTIGIPLPSTEIKLIDDFNIEILDFDKPGELCAKGPQVMKEYWNRPDETSKVIDDGWLKTGDIASINSSGFFKIVDRKKDLIIVSGFNVYPNEVEEAISTHPGVLEVAAIGIPDNHSGETVKVFVVKKDPNLNEEAIIAHAKKSLTGYKIPKAVEFRTELPKTNVGKILRRALR